MGIHTIKIDNFSLPMGRAKAIKSMADWEKIAKGKLKTMTIEQSYKIIKAEVSKYDSVHKPKKKAEKAVIENKFEKPVESNKSEK